MRKLKLTAGHSMRFFLTLCLVFSIVCASFPASATEPYDGYNYNSNLERVASPNGYLPTSEVNGNSLGISKLVKPTDIFVDAHDYIYITDAGDNKEGRVVKVDSDFNLVAEINVFVDGSEILEAAEDETAALETITAANAERITMKNLSGIYVTADGEMYLCDMGNDRVLRAMPKYDAALGAYIGVVRQIYTKPVTDMIAASKQFAPEKVVVTATGDMYILSQNITDGAAIITEEGVFSGFFGAEQVEMTLEKMLDYMWSKILSEKQSSKYAQNKEVRYSNMFLDGDFVYTVTSWIGQTTGQVKKVNPANANVIDSAEFKFGDATQNVDPSTGEILNASFVDITVDDEEFIFCLDSGSGKVYMYDQGLDLLTIFGSRGYKTGTFQYPIGIEECDGQILVLDQQKCSVTVFETTQFGDTVREAVSLYEHGKYEEALQPWEEVKLMNSNYEIAYNGIGRAYLMMGKAAEEPVYEENPEYKELKAKLDAATAEKERLTNALSEEGADKAAIKNAIKEQDKIIKACQKPMKKIEKQADKAFSKEVKNYYKLAMTNFKLAYNKMGYSDAKAELRSDLLRENFSLVLTILLIVIILYFVFKKTKEKIRKKLGLKTVEEKGYAAMSKWKYPFYTMLHPFDGYQEMRYNKKGSLGLGVLFLALWYLSEVIIRQFEDFTFNPTNPDKLNIFMILCGTAGLFMIAIASNWALCTLFDGKGKFKDIFIGASYAMLPTIIATFLVTFISKFMISGEAVFIQVILIVGYIWSAAMVIIGTQTIHEFEGGKGILMLFLTAVVMILVLFLIMLVYVLFMQVFSFIATLYYEIIYRVGV